MTLSDRARAHKISVDFCSGSRGPFLAINGVVVAGEIEEGTGQSVLLRSFEITGGALVDALQSPAHSPTHLCDIS